MNRLPNNQNLCHCAVFPRFAAVALLLLLLFVNPLNTFAATWNSDGSRASVQAMHDDASDGDIVTLPSGTFEWTTGVTITKAITLAGLGTVTKDVLLRATDCGTKIQCSVSGAVITWTEVAAKTSRMTAIQFIRGSAYAGQGVGAVTVSGVNTDARRFVMDLCVFDQLQNASVVTRTVLGVAHHCTFICNAAAVFDCDDASWNGTQGVDTSGNGSWADSEFYGSDKFFFYEDCTFIGELCHSSSTVTIAASGTVTFTVPAGVEVANGSPLTAGVPISVIYWDALTGKPDPAFAMYGTVDSYSGTTLVLAPSLAVGAASSKSLWTISYRTTGSDGQRGTRVVMRNNVMSNFGWQNHGTEASFTRGGRVVEFYTNWMVGNLSYNSPLFFRSGTGLIHDNHITNFQTSIPSFNLVNYSTAQYEGEPWGGPDGRNPWHSNAAAAIVTGTISSATPASLTARDNGKTWTLNQYQNYTVRATSGISVSSMTRSGSTVTVTTSGAHGLTTGDPVSIMGANQRWYNKLYSSSPGSATGCTVSDSTHFTVTINTTPATPATGTIICRKNGFYGLITSSATDGTMVLGQGVNGLAMTLQLQVGDGYEINQLYYAMDQCGMGAGSLLTPITEDPPAGWPDQVLSPLYQWNNGAAVFDARFDFTGANWVPIVENRNFYNNTQVPGWGTTVTNYTYPHSLAGSSPAAGPTGAISQTIGVSEAKSLPRRGK